MTDERATHDNRVLGYEVDGVRRRLVLHTAYEDGGADERTDVVFEGVIAYHLVDDVIGSSILFDVEEVELTQWAAENTPLLERGARYSWPGPWNRSVEAVVAYATDAGCKPFRISPSFGLDGWVLAQSCEVVAAEVSDT